MNAATETAPADPVPDDLIRPSRAARILKCHLATVYRYILSGRLRAWSRAGGHRLVSEAEVGALMRPVVVTPVPTTATIKPPCLTPAGYAGAMSRLRKKGWKV